MSLKAAEAGRMRRYANGGDECGSAEREADGFHGRKPRKTTARRNRPACTGGRTLDKCGSANAQCEAFDLEEHRGAVCGCLLVKQYIIIDCR